MKLRQKLAAVLATAMIVTSIPVVTMGASTNNLAKDVVKVVKNHQFADVTTANAVQVTFKDSTSTKETFYLELTNAEWKEEIFDAAVANAAAAGDASKFEKVGLKYVYNEDNSKVTYDLQGATSSKVVKVEVDLTGKDKSKPVRMPLIVETKDGDASVELVSRGGNTTITTGTKFVFATTSDKVATATVQAKEDLPTIYREGKLGEIYLDENYSNAFATGKEYTYTVEFDSSEYDFVSAELAGQYGFSSAKFTQVAASDAFATTGADDAIQYKFIKKDNAFELKLILGKDVKTDSLGRLIIKDIKVEATSKAPETGDFLVDIKGDTLSSKLTDVVLAKVSKYNVAIEMNKESKEEIVAGRTAEIKFELKETVKDSIATNRELTLAIKNSEFDYQELIAKYGVDAAKCETILKDDLTVEEKEKAIKKLSPSLKLDEMVKDGVITNDDKMITSIKFDKDEDGNIDPTTLVAMTAKGVDEDAMKVSFKMPVHVSIADKDAEKIQITAGGRALQDEVTVDAAKIVNPFNVTAEPFVVKVGLQGQVGGSIKLTETQAEMFKKGDIQIKLKDAEKVGITFTKDAKLTTEGSIKSTEIKTDKANKNVIVTLNRTSNEASSITISDFTLSVDRTVPEGSYDLEISGPSIDEKGQSIIIKDFIVVGTQNTEDVEAANGLAKGVSTFVIGESKYTINGKEKVMDAASYIQDPGYTMVPVRYVAEAFGVTGNNILFSKGVATIFAGNRTIQLTNGSDIAVVNGVQIKMATKVVMKDGRTYAPIGEVAQLLGITKAWNNDTKTATFENK